jgi:hypothetical protein
VGRCKFSRIGNESLEAALDDAFAKPVTSTVMISECSSSKGKR